MLNRLPSHACQSWGTKLNPNSRTSPRKGVLILVAPSGRWPALPAEAQLREGKTPASATQNMSVRWGCMLSCGEPLPQSCTVLTARVNFSSGCEEGWEQHGKAWGG